MTKKDYVLIAEAIKASYQTVETRQSLVAELGQRLAQDNPRFNYDTFKEACGISK